MFPGARERAEHYVRELHAHQLVALAEVPERAERIRSGEGVRVTLLAHEALDRAIQKLPIKARVISREEAI